MKWNAVLQAAAIANTVRATVLNSFTLLQAHQEYKFRSLYHFTAEETWEVLANDGCLNFQRADAYQLWHIHSRSLLNAPVTAEFNVTQAQMRMTLATGYDTVHALKFFSEDELDIFVQDFESKLADNTAQQAVNQGTAPAQTHQV